MDPNQLQSTQPSWYIFIGAIGGALLTGFLSLMGDILNRRRDREDKRNNLIGQLKGHKSLILQCHAFYFYSFISCEYLICRSIIQGFHGVDYEKIAPISSRSKQNTEFMRILNEKRERSSEHKSYLKKEKELNNWKWQLAKSKKQLWIIIGLLQNYYLNDSKFYDLSKQIEVSEDHYARLEKIIIDKFGLICNNTKDSARGVLKTAESSHRHSNDLRDDLFYEYIDLADETDQEFRTDLQKTYNDQLGRVRDLLKNANQ